MFVIYFSPFTDR